MKNLFLIVFAVAAIVSINSCEKCYRCHNICQVCQQQYHDTALTITVCSDIFGEDHYQEYLDSLTSPALGWVCHDAGSNRTTQYCGTKSGNSSELLNKKDQGWICAPE